MMKKTAWMTLVAAASLTVMGAAQASTMALGNWTAKSYIVGQTSTATVAAGGDPLYLATAPKYSGVAYVSMTFASGNSYLCTGSLLNDRRSVLTAAHCLTGSSADGALTSVSTYFYDGGSDVVVPSSAASVRYDAVATAVHSQYTGEVIDQHDVAVVTLGQAVDSRFRSYGLYTGADLTGVDYNIAGYGGRSFEGGTTGANLGTGRLRQGDNRFDFRMGDSDFGGFFTQASWYGSQAENVWLSDFDNGNSGNDMSCAIGGAFGLGGAKYCNTGRGATEVGTAGGDSGGPQFVNGLIAGVTSFGLTFGSDFGDFDDALNSSFGEFNGFASVAYNYDFIMSRYVPEPSSLALVALAGGALVLRRRKAAAKA